VTPIAAAKLSANPAVGSALTGAGTWDVATLTYAYQWLLDGVEIPGATGATYTPLANQLGDGLSLCITASRVGYWPETTTTNELNVALAAAAIMSATYKAAIAGVSTTTAFSAGTAATAATYQPVAADNSATLKVVLTASNPATQTGTFTTASTVAVTHCS
jgi:hypothetical protein